MRLVTSYKGWNCIINWHHISHWAGRLVDLATDKDNTPVLQISVTQTGNNYNRLLGARSQQGVGFGRAELRTRRHAQTHTHTLIQSPRDTHTLRRRHPAHAGGGTPGSADSCPGGYLFSVLCN